MRKRGFLALLVSIIGTILWTTDAWAVNGTEWRTAEGTAGTECTPVEPGEQCFWGVNTTGQSPLISKQCPSFSIRSHDSAAATEGLIADVYVCKSDTYADCLQLEATNLSTGTYEDVELTDAYWSVLDIPYGKIMLNVTNAGTCGTPDCYIIAECGD
jgi:hypothetical protein